MISQLAMLHENSIHFLFWTWMSKRSHGGISIEKWFRMILLFFTLLYIIFRFDIPSKAQFRFQKMYIMTIWQHHSTFVICCEFQWDFYNSFLFFLLNFGHQNFCNVHDFMQNSSWVWLRSKFCIILFGVIRNFQVIKLVSNGVNSWLNVIYGF